MKEFINIDDFKDFIDCYSGYLKIDHNKAYENGELIAEYKESAELTHDGIIFLSGDKYGCNIIENRQAFKNAEGMLKKRGYKNIVNPFKNGLQSTDPYSEHMKVDLFLLLQCNRIYMLDGWENSKRATLEYAVAKSCGIKELKL